MVNTKNSTKSKWFGVVGVVETVEPRWEYFTMFENLFKIF